MTGSPADGSPEAVVRDHELSLAPDRRKVLGAHYTPPELAHRIVGLAVEALGRTPRAVADPCCGAGSFLLAAADALEEHGVAAADVLTRLYGADADGEAVAAARRALQLWARRRGLGDRDVPEPHLDVADTLLGPPPWWPAVDAVVGNPPFLGQLGRATARSAPRRSAVAERFPSIGPYTDDAALFLLGAADLVGPGGVVALLQPQSLLGSRDAAPVRDAVLAKADLVGVWASGRSHFDAAVRVCAPVLRRRDTDRPAEERPVRPSVRVFWDDSRGEEPAPVAGAPWGPLLAGVAGLPELPPLPAAAATVASMASATAGFRDEFYAVAACTREPGEPGWSPVSPRVATVGMVDATDLAWGRRPARLAGRKVVAPRLDRAGLERTAPRVARWVTARLVPKVLVATQTRALEAVVDAAGDVVPVTPLVSVEPFDPGDVWLVAAALLAPPVAARGAAELLGSGRGSHALRWSSRSVLAVPLPAERAPWQAAADLLAAAQADESRRPELLHEAGSLLCGAHGMDADHPVLDWWANRVGAGPA